MTPEPQTTSWLLLERYALGELEGAQLRQVEDALARDEQTRACLAMIRSDLRALPPLPDVSAVDRSNASAISFWQRLGALRWVLAPVATLAVIGLFVLRPGTQDVRIEGDRQTSRGAHEPSSSHEKGGDVTLDLIREHRGSIAVDALQLVVGDRFKARVSCGFAHSGFAKLLVRQDGEMSSPLAVQRLACGNGVVLEGAFTFDREAPARVCVVLSPDARALDRLVDFDFDDASPNVDCVDLHAR